jgi:hypothetical protein
MNSRVKFGIVFTAGLAFVLVAAGVSRGNTVFYPLAGLLILFFAVFLYSMKTGLGGVYSICLGQPPVILLSMVNPAFSLAGELVVIALGWGIEVRTWSAGEGYLVLGFLLAAGIVGTVLLIPAQVGLFPPLVLVLALAGTGVLVLNEQRITLMFKGGKDET